MAPIVSVICLCYNHARFIEEALDSVMKQSYAQVELIIVDDASTDGSVDVIKKWLTTHPGVPFVVNPDNLGNCRAFNRGLVMAHGKYIIDLSGDDCLSRERVERGVALMESRPEVGVQFSDAELIDADGKRLGYHADRFPHATVPEGKIFRDVLSRYFINSPTLMIRKSLLDELGGYDESLAYEDFDFLIRSSPKTSYAYLPEALVQRRVLPGSMGKQQYAQGSAQQRSTLTICQKAFTYCSSPDDFRALRLRVNYELRQSLRYAHWSLAWSYLRLLWKIP